MTSSVRHSRPFSSGMLEEMSLTAFFTLSWVYAALGMGKYFGGRLSDQILAALVHVTSWRLKGEQRITNVLAASTVSHSDIQAVHSSLFSNGASFSLYSFTPQQIHIWTSPKPAAETTGKGRPVIDKNLHNDKMAWNQVLLTSCNVSRRRRWDELEEAMGNTANLEGSTLYARKSMPTICGVFEKTKTLKPCLPIS